MTGKVTFSSQLCLCVLLLVFGGFTLGVRAKEEESCEDGKKCEGKINLIDI